MTEPRLRITRSPYEEPYHLNLLIEASNGRVRGQLEYYSHTEDLRILGEKFVNFTGQRGEETTYELGSEDPSVPFAFFLRIRLVLLDSRGHGALAIRLNNNQPSTDREITEFAIEVTVADINRLGRLLVSFGRLQHRVLEWDLESGSLTE